MHGGRAERDGWVRASQHSLCQQFGVDRKAVVPVAERFFSKRAREVPATVPSAGGACLRRIPEFSPRHMSAHLAHTVAEETSFSSIRSGLRHEEHLWLSSSRTGHRGDRTFPIDFTGSEKREGKAKGLSYTVPFFTIQFRP